MLSHRKCVLLEQLWQEQAHTMRAYVIARTGDPTEAEEVVAEVYWRACRSLARNGLPRRHARGWLWQILHHYRIDCARRRARAPVHLPWLEGTGSLPPRGEETRIPGLRTQLRQLMVEPPDPVAMENRMRVRAALARLPERHARLVTMRNFEGYSLAECAAAYGITCNAAKALYHRALLGLRRAMRDEATR